MTNKHGQALMDMRAMIGLPRVHVDNFHTGGDGAIFMKPRKDFVFPPSKPLMIR